jgi:hypothetical protein
VGRRESPALRALIAATALACVAAVLLAPFKLCLFAILLRIPCPGCGMTRALLATLRGDFHQAFALNPLALVVAPWTSAAVVRHAIAYVRTGDAWRVPATPRGEQLAASALLVLLVLLWGARFAGYFGGPVPV